MPETFGALCTVSKGVQAINQRQAAVPALGHPRLAPVYPNPVRLCHQSASLGSASSQPILNTSGMFPEISPRFQHLAQ